MADRRRLSTRQVATRLGVKPQTVYAYVSRGLLTSRRGPGGRASTFDPDEVERLAGRRRGEPGGPHDTRDGDGVQPAAAAAGLVHSSVTLVEAGGHHYRGVDARALAGRYGYEEVAWWLWTGTLRRGTRFAGPPEAVAAARAVGDALPRPAGLVDRLRVAAVAAAAADPVRFDLRPGTVAATAGGLVATLVEALPARDPARPASPASPASPGTGPGQASPGTGPGQAEPGRPEPGAASLAERLWPRLTGYPADPAAVRVLDTALVLLADHGLAASTVTARAAASARAHPYAVVSAALGTLEGPLHGAASGLAHRMLADVLERGAGAVVAEHLRAGRRLPGLGHRLYPGEDPRARVLLDLLAEVPGTPAAGDVPTVLAAVGEVSETAARHLPLHPNIDLALAALSVATGMPAEAGETVFAVARTAGWIAHALEEYEEPAMRVRVTGRYEGPPPPQPLP